MPASAAIRASDLIWDLWTRGEVIDDLAPDLKPSTREAGYAIQSGLDRHSSRPRAGWKIAATSTAGQKHIGVAGPLAGRIYAERVLRPGAAVSLTGNRMRVAEPEFAFRLGRTLSPRAGRYTVDDVMAAVSALHLTIELPDSRFSDFVSVGGPTLIADNACARDLLIGSEVTADWRNIDLSRHAVKARMGAKGERDGTGSNVLGDPRQALTWIANELSSLGIPLAAGEIVTTGTCMVPIAIEPGDAIEADFGSLGKIGVTLSA